MALKAVSLFTSNLLALAAGITIAAAWWLPLQGEGAFLAWCGVFALLAAVNSSRAQYRTAWIAGCAAYFLGFYWLYGTIQQFGGFPHLAAAAIFGLFVATGGAQFLVFVFLFRHLPRTLDSLYLRAPIAWCVMEFMPVRIFPWQIAHTQIGFLPFAQISDIGGSLLVSFIMVWCLSALQWRRCVPTSRLARILPYSVFLLALAYGGFRLYTTDGTTLTPIKVLLVQGNVSIEEKHSVKYISNNIQRYKDLTKEYLSKNDQAQPTLIVWPETAFTDWIAAGTAHISHDPRLPYFGPSAATIFGALTFASQDVYHNSALAIDQSGRVLPPYHKQILMPFGEYTPLSSLLPWLKTINANVADFTAGKSVELFTLPGLTINDTNVVAAPLICYEDIIPSLADLAAAQGANLLINLTNDAWFGDSVAPYQHHMIAAFRAIETRRPLLRATNSGFTAIVDTFGRTTGSLPLFSDGIEAGVVQIPIAPSSIYVDYFGDALWIIVSLLAIAAAGINFVRQKGRPAC